MTTETANKLVEIITTLLGIAGCPTIELISKWYENPSVESIYKAIENAEYIYRHKSSEFEFRRYLFFAAKIIADTIAQAETH